MDQKTQLKRYHKYGITKDIPPNHEGDPSPLEELLDTCSFGIKKVPRRKRTINVSTPLSPTISPISSDETRSGGLSIGIGSAVFKYGRGTIRKTLSPIENSIEASK